MATINDFKREISELVKAQKVAKRINHQSEVYRNRGLLHAMYVAYYILKHKLVGDAQEAYYKQVLDSWKNLKPMVMVIMPLPVEMVLLFGTMMKFVSFTLLDIR